MRRAAAPALRHRITARLAHSLVPRCPLFRFSGKWHLGYPTTNITVDERRRVQQANPAHWKEVQPVVQAEYRKLRAHVRRCGFEWAERVYVNNLYAEQHVLPARMLHHNLEWIADGASELIASPRRRGRPFFLYIGWTLPHNPDAAESLDADPRFTPGGMWRFEGALSRAAVKEARLAVRLAAGVAGDAPRDARLGHRHYPLALAWMDSAVGMVLDAVGHAREENGTAVLFTSDHQVKVTSAAVSAFCGKLSGVLTACWPLTVGWVDSVLTATARLPRSHTTSVTATRAGPKCHSSSRGPVGSRDAQRQWTFSRLISTCSPRSCILVSAGLPQHTPQRRCGCTASLSRRCS